MRAAAAIAIFILVVPLLAFIFEPSVRMASLVYILGGLIVIFGFYHLVYVLPRMAKDMETRISLEAHRASFWLVIFGLVIIVLSCVYMVIPGLLDLMKSLLNAP